MKKINLILAIILIIGAFLSIFVGVLDMTPLAVLQRTPEQLLTLFTTRLPRLVAVIITGVGMSVCGLVMQRLMNNRFVSPTTAATVNFSQLGLIISLMMFSQTTLFQRTLISFIVTLLGSFLFLSVVRRVQFNNTLLIPIIGIMLGGVVSGVTTFIAYQYGIVQNITSFTQGSFTNILDGNFEILYIALPFVILSFFYATKFTLAGMGEDMSSNLGLNYNQVVAIGLTIVSIITAAITVVVGMIPFIGLIVPNIISEFLGDNLKNSLLTTALVGAIFLLICDVISRLLIFPFEIPISLTAGIIGSVVFLIILLRRGLSAT